MRIGAGGGSTEERIAEPIGGLHGVLTGGRTDVDAPATRAWSEQLSLTDGTSCDACRWQRRERFFAAIQNPTNGETVHSSRCHMRPPLKITIGDKAATLARRWQIRFPESRAHTKLHSALLDN